MRVKRFIEAVAAMWVMGNSTEITEAFAIIRRRR